MANPQTAAALEPSLFRKVLGTFPTGVTVVTAKDGAGGPIGLTANSFTSVSLNPPLVLVCVDHRSNSLGPLRSSKSFAINILSEEQKELCMLFASKTENRFEHINWAKGVLGDPIFPDAIGILECETHQIVEAGDHDIIIGRAVSAAESASRPLGYFRGGFYSVSLEQDATLVDGKSVFAVIVEGDKGVLLHRPDQDQPWSFPECTARNSYGELGGLKQKLADAGARTVLNFLYSVAEIPDRKCTMILYRGELEQDASLTDPKRWSFFEENAIPWDNLSSYETEMTLRRYFREKGQDRFGLFADTGGEGRLAPISSELPPYSREDAERILKKR